MVYFSYVESTAGLLKINKSDRLCWLNISIHGPDTPLAFWISIEIMWLNPSLYGWTYSSWIDKWKYYNMDMHIQHEHNKITMCTQLHVHAADFMRISAAGRVALPLAWFSLQALQQVKEKVKQPAIIYLRKTTAMLKRYLHHDLCLLMRNVIIPV